MIKRIQQVLVEALGGTLLGDRASAASQDDQLIGFRSLTSAPASTGRATSRSSPTRR
jgi:hypothetical protein